MRNMSLDYKINKEIRIKTNKSELWKALTNPELIKQYLMGTNVISEWKEGSKIVYQGNFNGIDFKDEGVIDILDIEKRYQYSYWSNNHGTENKPENYVSILYDITENNEEVILEVTQSNYKSKEIADGMEQIWELILSNLKMFLEE
jgi:uncharacterized protein YndB with AHSA1/START domain